MNEGKSGHRFLITGCSGFIGFHLSKRLLEEGNEVIGLDSLNDYYDLKLKTDRLAILQKNRHFSFYKGSVENLELLENIFMQHRFDVVIHMAAQAGVRYSLKNPYQYVHTNVTGFLNILECCKTWKINHLLYASSSSVYGANGSIPFSEQDCTEKPVNIYAATKKANELMAYSYSHIYKLPVTGLRFFTVYGPWGRPDMAVFTFTEAIVKGKPIEVYNYGNMKRDFTYIDDVVESMVRLIKKGPPALPLPCEVYNIGNHKPVEVKYLIDCLERQLGIPAKKVFLPMQPGEVPETYADIDGLKKAINYQPRISIEEGIKRFVSWYKDYYQIG